MKATKILSILAVVALVGSVGSFTLVNGALAQGMGKGQGIGQGPGRGEMPVAERILKKARRLDLSDEAFATLKGIVKDASAQMKSLREEKRTTHMALKTLLMAQELDKAAIATESDKLAEVQKSLTTARTSLMLEIREKMGVEFVTDIEGMMGKRQRDGRSKGYRGDYRSGDCDECREERREERRHRRHRSDRCDDMERRYDGRGSYDRGYDRDCRCDYGPRD